MTNTLPQSKNSIETRQWQTFQQNKRRENHAWCCNIDKKNKMWNILYRK